MNPSKMTCILSLLVLAGCGTPSTPRSSSGFGMAASKEAAASVEDTTASENQPSNPNATFKGCWYKQGKNRYQAVDLSLGNPGTYTFNAYLYHGTTCNPNDIADQIGNGEKINFGDVGWTFWFDRFANQKNMSARWYVGSDSSVCVDYETAPGC